jgi:hypothetical protein
MNELQYLEPRNSIFARRIEGEFKGIISYLRPFHINVIVFKTRLFPRQYYNQLGEIRQTSTLPKISKK